MITQTPIVDVTVHPLTDRMRGRILPAWQAVYDSERRITEFTPQDWEARAEQKRANLQVFFNWRAAVYLRFGHAGLTWADEHVSGAPRSFVAGESYDAPQKDQVVTEFFKDVWPGQHNGLLGSSRDCWLAATWWLWHHPEVLSS